MKPPSSSEAQFLNQVLAVAKLFGWQSAHFRPALTAKGWRTAVQGDGMGWPDIALAKGGKMLFLELKSEKGRLSLQQEEWLKTLNGCSTTAMMVRPSDFDTLVELLKEGNENKG